jgi:hypothetical protein
MMTTLSWLSGVQRSFPVIKSLSVQNINLTDSERRMRVHVNHLAIDGMQNSGELIVVGAVAVDKIGFKINNQFGAISEIFNQRRPILWTSRCYLPI